MRHHEKQRVLSRTRNQRTALMRSLARALILEGGITTTQAKAKEVRPFIERLVTHARQDTVAKRRLVARALGNDTEATKKLFIDIAPRYRERPGGYTRINRLRVRPSDACVETRISFV